MLSSGKIKIKLLSFLMNIRGNPTSNDNSPAKNQTTEENTNDYIVLCHDNYLNPKLIKVSSGHADCENDLPAPLRKRILDSGYFGPMNIVFCGHFTKEKKQQIRKDFPALNIVNINPSANKQTYA